MSNQYDFVKNVQSSKMTDQNSAKLRKNHESNDASSSSIFKNEDLVIEIMKFLGVRSMVTFGSCSKSLRDEMGREVRRRKKHFVNYKSRFKALLKDANPCPANVFSARLLYSAAGKLIDDELDYLEIPPCRFQSLPKYPFKDEVLQFRVVGPDYDDPPVFHMLPLCFYFSPKEEAPFQLSTQEIQLAMDRAWNIVELEECACQRLRIHDPYYDDPNYPFRKYEQSCADFFRNIMIVSANKLKCDARDLESFRVAARKLALSYPRTQDCLHFVLHSAEMNMDDHSQRVGVEISTFARLPFICDTRG